MLQFLHSMRNDLHEIEHKANGIHVTIFSAKKVVTPIQEETTKEIEIPLVEVIPQVKPLEVETQKPSFIKEWWTTTKEQIFSTPPQDTKIWITTAAREFMGRNGITREEIKKTVMYGNCVPKKKDRIYKKYNGYVIETITTYDKASKTYTVLAAWKKSIK